MSRALQDSRATGCEGEPSQPQTGGEGPGCDPWAAQEDTPGTEGTQTAASQLLQRQVGACLLAGCVAQRKVEGRTLQVRAGLAAVPAASPLVQRLPLPACPVEPSPTAL